MERIISLNGDASNVFHIFTELGKEMVALGDVQVDTGGPWTACCKY